VYRVILDGVLLEVDPSYVNCEPIASPMLGVELEHLNNALLLPHWQHLLFPLTPVVSISPWEGGQAAFPRLW
jgi:hypothetical protein